MHHQSLRPRGVVLVLNCRQERSTTSRSAWLTIAVTFLPSRKGLTSS